MRRPLTGALLVLASLVPALAAVAAEPAEERVVEVVEVTGLLDDRILRFVAETVESAAERGTVEVVILQIDSRGVVGDPDLLAEVADLVSDPPLPVVAWVGPAPAVAYGGAAQLAAAAPLTLAAPGSAIGYWEPTIAGDPESAPLVEAPADVSGVVVLDEPAAGVDVVAAETASPRQVAQYLHGRTLPGGAGPLDTVRPFTAEDGTEGVTVLETVIRQPGLVDRFLRLGASPEAAFFFLVAGLTVAAFELYAIGPGVAAGVAALSLFLASFGIAVLPVRGWAVALAVASVLLLAVSYQLGGILLLTVLGIAGVAVSGFFFTDAAPQFEPGALGVLGTVVAAAFFFLLAMPTVARSRFSVQIGRSDLVGRQGRAVSALTPDGQVELDGATWQATSHREAGIVAGDVVVVTGIDGWVLEVDKVADPGTS